MSRGSDERLDDGAKVASLRRSEPGQVQRVHLSGRAESRSRPRANGGVQGGQDMVLSRSAGFRWFASAGPARAPDQPSGAVRSRRGSAAAFAKEASPALGACGGIGAVLVRASTSCIVVSSHHEWRGAVRDERLGAASEPGVAGLRRDQQHDRGVVVVRVPAATVDNVDTVFLESIACDRSTLGMQG